MKKPCISIDRRTKRYAIFDGFDCIGGFKPYTDEETALATARAEIAKLTDKEPEVVYPVVKSVRMTTKSVRIRQVLK